MDWLKFPTHENDFRLLSKTEISSFSFSTVDELFDVLLNSGRIRVDLTLEIKKIFAQVFSLHTTLE
jgi:hypothetical protein